MSSTLPSAAWLSVDGMIAPLRRTANVLAACLAALVVSGCAAMATAGDRPATPAPPAIAVEESVLLLLVSEEYEKSMAERVAAELAGEGETVYVWPAPPAGNALQLSGQLAYLEGLLRASGIERVTVLDLRTVARGGSDARPE